MAMLDSVARDDLLQVGLASTTPATAEREAYTTATEAGSIVFELVETRAAFDRLEQEWNELFERAGQDAQLFQQFNWMWHWCNHYLPADGRRGPQLAIVVGRRGGRCVMIWPLVVERRHLLRQLSWMGEPVGQYGDVLIEGEPAERQACLADGWRFICARLRPDVMHLRKVRHDARVRPLLTALAAIESNRQEAPYLDFAGAGDFTAYEERFSAKSRKNRRRLLRRMAERDSVAFEHHREGEVARDLARLSIILKRAWLRDRGLLSPALSDDRALAFFGDVAHGRGRPTGCHVSTLRAGGEPAAIEVGFQCRSRLALHVIVYSLKFEKSGAGSLLLEDTFRRGFELGIGTCDLLAPKADYKMDWADASTAVDDYTVPVTMPGRLYARAYLGYARERMKRLYAGLPPVVRRALMAALVAVLLAPPS